MSKKILLLDCSKELFARLKRQGFDVEEGNRGYATGIKKLLRPIYEYNIIIYNPSKIYTKFITEGFDDQSPEYDFSELKQCLLRGAVLVTFINTLVDNERLLNQVYDWIPYIPQIQFTKDYQIDDNSYPEWVKPLLLPTEVKIPVTTKLSLNFPTGIYHQEHYFNKNKEILGVSYSVQYGNVLILPTYNSNDDIATIFLNRSIKKIFEDTSSNLIDLFRSSEEQKIENEIISIGESIKTLESELEKSNEELAAATRTKVSTISSDETSKLIINYYKLATDQEDSAIFYLYKIIDALKKKFSEKEAKNILKCNKEFNLIGTLANQSYADARHAPYPEEKIKELTTAEIEACFASAITIISSYFEHLFSNKSPTTVTK